MPPGDAKQAELARLKNKMLEVEAQLKEEKKVTAKLRYTSERKTLQLMQADEDTTAEIEQFRWKREEIFFIRKSMEDAAKAKIRSLREEQNALRLNMASFDLITYENEMFNERLKEVSNEQLRNAEAQLNERNSSSQRNFDARIEMDNLHSSTVKDFDDNYQKEAIAKMKIEASQANSENDRIYREFGIREHRTNELIDQQQLSYEQLMHLRIERDVMAVSVQLQEKDIADLTAQNQQLSQELLEAAVAVEALRKNIDLLQLAVAEKNRVLRRIENLEELVLPLQRKVSSVAHEVNSICHKLLYEGLEIVKKERAYQSSQISAKMGNLGSKLTKSQSAQYTDEQLREENSEENNHQQQSGDILRHREEENFGFHSPEPQHRGVQLQLHDLTSPSEQSEVFPHLLQQQQQQQNEEKNEVGTSVVSLTLYEQLQQQQQALEEAVAAATSSRSIGGNWRPQELHPELLWRSDVTAAASTQRTLPSATSTTAAAGATSAAAVRESSVRLPFIIAQKANSKQKKGFEDPMVRRKLIAIDLELRKRAAALEADGVAASLTAATAATDAVVATDKYARTTSSLIRSLVAAADGEPQQQLLSQSSAVAETSAATAAVVDKRVVMNQTAPAAVAAGSSLSKQQQQQRSSGVGGGKSRSSFSML